MGRLLSYFLLGVAMFLWGSSFVALKAAFAAANPWAIIWLRMSIAAFAGLLFLPLFPRAHFKRGDFVWMLAMVLFEPCLYFVFETKALQYTSAAQAGAITAVLPLFVGFAASFFLGERIGGRFILGVVVAFMAAVTLSIVSEPSTVAPSPLTGNFYEVLAMLSAAGYVVAVKKLTARYHPWHLVLMQNLAGMFFFLPFTFIGDNPFTSLLAPGFPWPSVLYLGLGVSLGAFLLYNFALKELEASKAAVFTYLIPVFAASLSVVLLGEKLGLFQLIAIGLILLGVFVAESGNSEKA